MDQPHCDLVCWMSENLRLHTVDDSEYIIILTILTILLLTQIGFAQFNHGKKRGKIT